MSGSRSSASSRANTAGSSLQRAQDGMALDAPAGLTGSKREQSLHPERLTAVVCQGTQEQVGVLAGADQQDGRRLSRAASGHWRGQPACGGKQRVERRAAAAGSGRAAAGRPDWPTARRPDGATGRTVRHRRRWRRRRQAGRPARQSASTCSDSRKGMPASSSAAAPAGSSQSGCRIMPARIGHPAGERDGSRRQHAIDGDVDGDANQRAGRGHGAPIAQPPCRSYPAA